MSLKIDQQIYITAKLQNDSRIYISKIEDISGDTIAVEFPLSKDNVNFQPRTLVQIEYIYQSNRFRFTTVVKGKKKDRIPLLLLARPMKKHIKKIQQRQYFRVETNINIDITLKGQPIEAHPIDISAGGLSFFNKKSSLYKGEMVEGKLYIPLKSAVTKSISFTAQVVRISPSSKREEYQQTAVQFNRMEEKSRNLLLQYCFQRQLDLKKKGVL